MASEREQAARIMRELRGLAEGATKDIGRSLISELPAVTPRDTGFTAASWRASRGRPVTAPVGSRSNVGAAKSAQDASRGEIDRFTLGDRTLHVANPLPNATALNNGSSKQEPASFIQRAITRSLTLAKASTSARAAVGRRRGR